PQQRPQKHAGTGRDAQKQWNARDSRPGVHLRVDRSTPYVDQVCRLENRRPDRRKRPRVPELPEPEILRQTRVVPVFNVPVIELEHEPKRNRGDRKKNEFTRVRAHPRTASRPPHNAVGKEDESRPGDGRIPGIERLDPRERGALRDNHHEQAHHRERIHVTRPWEDSAVSFGAPTPLPRTITFIVLPRPPGMTSVFSASR